MRVGRLGRPHGLDGFLGLYVEPSDLVYFEPGAVVHVDGRPFTVKAVRRTDRGHQVSFEEVADRGAAESIRNTDLYASHRRERSEGEYWPEELIGLEVRPGGGTVIGLAYGPTQDRLVIEREGSEFEVPFVEALVPVVDLDSGFVVLEEIEGLIGPSG